MRPFLALAIVISLTSCRVEEAETVEIPLQDIWALDMPGTRDVHELELEVFKNIGQRPSDEQLALVRRTRPNAER